MQFSPKDAVVARSLSVKLNSRGNAIYMCVYALLKHLRGSFSHLDWLGFILDRKKKRFQTGLLSILEGGISPFFFPFFLFFHFHSSIFPNSPIPSNQFQFNRVVSLLRVNVTLAPLFQFFLEGSVFLRSIKNRDTLPQKSQLTIVDSFSSSKSISLHFPLNL